MTRVNVVDDAAVVEQSRRDPELFATIYDRHFAGICRYVASQLGPDAADDLAGAAAGLASGCSVQSGTTIVKVADGARPVAEFVVAGGAAGDWVSARVSSIPPFYGLDDVAGQE